VSLQRERIGRRCYLTAGAATRARRTAKRDLHRYWRRWARRDPEGAPTRPPTRGWID
jgi:hypothetical protein